MLVVMLGFWWTTIVVADNYVELLDQARRGLRRRPLRQRHRDRRRGATLAIIAAFLPNLFTLTGSVGEFIHSMPMCDDFIDRLFRVAFFFTPLVCRRFISKDSTPMTAARQGSLVDRIESRYEAVAA